MFKYEQVYASGGKGVKIGGEVVYFFTENMGIMVASGYSMKGGYDWRYIDPLIKTVGTGETSYLPINVGLKFKAKMGIIGIALEPYVYVAPGVFFPKKTETSTTWDMTDTTVANTMVRTYTYPLSFSVSAGTGVAVMLPFISDKLGLKVEFAPTYAFANLIKYTEKTTDRNGNTTLTTYRYKNNTPPDSLLGTGQLPDQPHDSYCSMAVRAGLCFKIF
jgi:hypothetical protein